MSKHPLEIFEDEHYGSKSTWQTTTPPTDREIIIIANITGKDGESAHCSIPYVGRARWDAVGHRWIGGDDMTITRYYDETLHIHYWIDDPSIPVAVPDNTITHD